jgi:hypothetical protein
MEQGFSTALIAPHRLGLQRNLPRRRHHHATYTRLIHLKFGVSENAA